MSRSDKLKVAFADDVTDIPVAPPAHIFTDDCPTDIDQQVTYFHEHGFVVLRDVLDARTLDELRTEIDRIARDHDKLTVIREGFGIEPQQDPNRQGPSFRKIGGIVELSDAFDRHMKHPTIVELLHRITGSDYIDLFRDVVMMKPARVGREKPWHQDSVYWPVRPMALVSAWTALDDATLENGCMQVIPGSHREQVQHYGQELRIDLTPEQQANTWAVPMAAGDVLLFHSLCLHASQPNRSAHDRRGCIISYRPGNTEYFEGRAPQTPIVVSDRRASG